MCFFGCLVPVPPTTGQAQSAHGTDARAIEQGDAARGESLFRQHYLACHRAETLVKAVFLLEEVGSDRLCVFLQTHGATDEARDCDLITYLDRVASKQWSKIEMEGK